MIDESDLQEVPFTNEEIAKKVNESVDRISDHYKVKDGLL